MEHDFQVEEWVVSPKLNSLRRNGTVVRLEPKVMQVLVCLADSADVVSKEKLMQTVWADTFVTDDVLTRSISELRKAFEDDRRNPRYIQTIPKGGYRLIAPVEEVGSAKKPKFPADEVRPPELELPEQTPNRLPLALVIGLALLILAYSIGKYTAKTPVRAGRAMLAILPFRNLGNDSQQDYFADGLTAEMISQFGRLPSERLGVIAWNTMARYRGASQNEDQIGKDLGANYLLEGTVRRSGNEVRVTAELLQAGKRDHVWSNSYAGTLDNVLSLQNRLAREIASEILVQLSPQESASFDGNTAVNGAGYDAYLKGKAASQAFSVNEMRGKVESLNRAIQLNPKYSPPYIEMADYYIASASRGFSDPKMSYEAARPLIEKALDLDPGSAAAHGGLAWIHWRYDWNFVEADEQFRKALEMNPNNANCHNSYALFLKSMGRYDEALAQSIRARELNPMEPYGLSNAGSLLALMKRYDAAEQQFARAIQLAPQEPYPYERLGPVYLVEGKNAAAIEALEKARDYSGGQQDKLAWLGYAYAASGRKSDALKVLDQLNLQRERGQYVSPLYIALIYNGLGDREQTFAWLQKAYAARDEYLVYLRIYPEFQNLHSDERFQALARRIGLPA